jgi:hypothetical protein
MKFVLNKCFGGFSVSDWAAEQLGLKSVYDAEYDDPHLIELVEKFPDKVSGDCAKLKVVEIPDDCTDYEFNDYDGFESITYVVDGKIYHA